MKKLIILERLLFLGFIVSICSLSISAQPTQVNPISTYKSIDSDDPYRFFHPADIGIPAGDINGDGLQEYINHTGFSADLSTSELGDYINKSLVCNYSDEGERMNCSVYDGGFLYPAGDLNNDGRDELILFDEDQVDVYSFGTGELDVSVLPAATYFVVVDGFFDQAVPGYDLDIDGVEDVVIADYDFGSGGTLCALYGAEDPEDFELKCSSDDGDTDWFDLSVGTENLKVNVGDVIGDDGNEIVVLHSSEFPYQFSASVISVDDQRVFTHESTTPLGSGNLPAGSNRFYVANADGENKDDLIYSEDRYNQGNGFTQIFFNEPNAYIAQSIPGEIPFTSQRILLSGNTVNQVSRSIRGDIGLAFTNKTSLSICFGTDIFDASMEPPGDACTNPQEVTDQFAPGDQVFENLFSPSILLGINGPASLGAPEVINFFLGHLSREGFSGGARTITADAINKDFITGLALFNLINIFSDIFRVSVTNPSPPELPFGVASFAEFMPTGFFTINTQVGVPLSIIGSEEAVNVTGSEPNNLFGANGSGIHVNIFGAADLLGNEGFTFYFKNTSAENDTSMVERIINLHDFQQFDDTLVYPGANNIGDINNDGFDDILFGSKSALSSGSIINKAWVFYGAETYNPSPDLTLDFNQDSTVPAFAFLNVGGTIEPLDDVNEDGIDDFALGLTGHMGTGVVYVYFGEDNSEKSSMVFDYPDIILKPRVLAGQTISSFGSQISAGDFDGDGTVDIAVGSDFSFGTPSVPTIQIFNGGAGMDGEADVFLSATKSSLGDSGDDIVSGTSLSSIQFLPSEEDELHQDILFAAGNVFGGYNDAVIFEGGAQADSIPDIQLVNPNDKNGFGFFNRSKPAVGDLNDDGFYDIILVNQSSNEDAFVSSRAYIYSPNSGIEVSNEEELENIFGYSLSQNYPNPFNPATNIEFRLPKASNVSITIFDVLGRKVATLVDDKQFSSGSNFVPFDASNLASGIYLYRLEAGTFTQTRKMTLIK